MEEKYFVEYNGKIVEYVLEKSKRRTIGIIVKEAGNVIVRAPLKMPNYKVFEFVDSKKKWIVEKHIDQKNKFKKVSFKDGEFLKVLGKEYKLEIQKYGMKQLKLNLYDDKIVALVPNTIEQNEEALIENAYDKLILKIAKNKIPEEMEKVSNIVGLKPRELRIRNFKRAWGNCSSKKIISMNKNLCKFSENAIDYVCLHELCHLKYMNHSKDFWNMVKTYMPNYKEVEKELK